LDEDAAGLSPTTIARLTAGWEKEYTDFRQRDLSGREYVYVWVDGVHFNIRLDDDRLCTLVMIGARPDGRRSCWRSRTVTGRAPRAGRRCCASSNGAEWSHRFLAVDDGALGFWAAAREVWPETREQGCWCHKLANVFDKLPQRLHARAKRALHEMMYAARRSDCEAARARFAAEHQAKYPISLVELKRRKRHFYILEGSEPTGTHVTFRPTGCNTVVGINSRMPVGK
jgi:putative transposase